MKKIILKIIITAGFILAMTVLVQITSAQNGPELMITWKANSYVPSDYRGKVLATTGTIVEIAFELLDKGRLVDISKNEVRWFLNNKLKGFGAGLKILKYTVASFDSNLNLRIQIPNYLGNNLEFGKIIPITKPEVVIASPYPDDLIEKGLNELRGLMYYFNINGLSQLQLAWSANDLKTGGVVQNPDILNLDSTNLSSGTSINVALTAENINNPIENASTQIQLFVK